MAQKLFYGRTTSKMYGDLILTDMMVHYGNTGTYNAEDANNGTIEHAGNINFNIIMVH